MPIVRGEIDLMGTDYVIENRSADSLFTHGNYSDSPPVERWQRFLLFPLCTNPLGDWRLAAHWVTGDLPPTG